MPRDETQPPEAKDVQDIIIEGEELETTITPDETDEATDDTVENTAKIEDDPSKEEEDDWSVTIGEEEPDPEVDHEDEPQDKPEETKTFRELRKKLRETQKEVKKLKRQTKKQEEEKLPDLGEKPKLEDFDYDEEQFETAIIEYKDRERKHKAAAEEAKKRTQALQQSYDKRLEEYETRKSEIGEDVPEYDDAEDAVRSAFDVQRQSIIISATKDPAIMILALGQRPRVMQRLAAIADPIVFAAELARLEGSLQVKGTKSKRATPERRVKSGDTATTNGAGGTKLKQLEAKAAKTGDRTELQRYKRELAKAKK